MEKTKEHLLLEMKFQELQQKYAKVQTKILMEKLNRTTAIGTEPERKKHQLTTLSYFEFLPYDTMYEIFSYLDSSRDVFSLMGTSKAVYRFFDFPGIGKVENVEFVMKPGNHKLHVHL